MICYSSFLVECACTRPDCLVKAHNSKSVSEFRLCCQLVKIEYILIVSSLFPSTDTSGDVPQSEVEIDSSPTRKGRKPGPKKDKTKLQKKRNISESKKMKNKDGKMKDKVTLFSCSKSQVTNFTYV